MMKWYNYILAFSLSVTILDVNGQDHHFTQFYASPLTLNPALTGMFDGDIRAAAIYRSQWPVIDATYTTASGSIDAGLLRQKLDGDYLGVGAVITRDAAGPYSLNTLSANFSLAYSMGFGYKKRHKLSAGLAGGLIQKSLGSLANATFPDGPETENPVLGSTLSIIDVSAGLVYLYQSNERIDFYIGSSLWHPHIPRMSLAATDTRLTRKYGWSGGAVIELSNFINLLPAISYWRQAPAQQFLFGSYVQFVLEESDYYPDNETSISFGLFNRHTNPSSDAVSLVGRFDWQQLTAAISYDINISELRTVSTLHGALEAGIIYRFRFTEPTYGRLGCPAF